MALNRPWTIYLIHHSHTDIGYTERQDKITNTHRDFIRQAIGILNGIHSGGISGAEGFVWQCENYWQVKAFYEDASAASIADFEKYVKSGEIGLSGNYLNMTELIGYPILDAHIAQAKAYGDKIGVPVKSAMTADINGMAWGYADALYGNGVQNLFSCLHAHHGMFPLYKKQTPFYWESPGKNKVLVWNGELYHFGNELHFAPRAGSSYTIRDEIARDAAKGLFRVGDAAELAVLDQRLDRYLGQLEEEGYPYDFVPFMISGAVTDNAPPSAAIAARANVINARPQGGINVKMVTLDQFFDHVRAGSAEIPTFRGDWNDWWADGVGSTPAVVKNFRDAQRKYSLCEKLDPQGTAGDPAWMEDASENLMMYAEHTWGYSSSVSEPWETMVGDLELKKAAYAINGNTVVSKNLDRILAAKGETTIQQDGAQRYKMINPHDDALKTTACLYIEYWEYIGGRPYTPDQPIEVVEEKTGRILKSQVKPIARACQVEVLAEWQPHEEKIVLIRSAPAPKAVTSPSRAYMGAEGITDIVQSDGYEENISRIETDFFRVSIDGGAGIQSIIDKKTGGEILRSDALYPVFSGVYEVTAIRTTACEERRRMGRNRKDTSTKRCASTLTDIQIVENAEVYIGLRLDYALQGTKFYSVYLKIYKGIPKIQATVRLHKESVWDPENLYIALPFTAGEGEVKFIDKTGCVIRPGIDQLPGTNKEFYLLQNGAVFAGADKEILICVRDTPLVTFGGLGAKPIRLCTGHDEDFNRSTMFSWAMNNFWETNFKADLGGFYSFAYTVSVGEKLGAEQSMKRCEAENEGIMAFRM